MSLLIPDQLDMRAYFDQLPAVTTRRIVVGGNPPSPTVHYLDRDDRCIGHMASDASPNFAAMIWDPNLIDFSSARVGDFTSPIVGGEGAGFPFFLSDFEPGATSDVQRLYQSTTGAANFQELSYSDPTILLSSNAWPKIKRNGPVDFSVGQQFYWTPFGLSNGQFIFFPGIDLVVVANCRLYEGSGPTIRDNIVIFVELSTGKGTPAVSGDNGIIGRYALGEHQFNAGPIFGETAVDMHHLQFLPDAESTHLKPRGEIFMWSAMPTASPSGDVIYLQFYDFNPSDVDGTPNRVHLRRTLLSRVNLQDGTIPVGDPPVPLNAWIPTQPNSSKISGFFTTFGSRRIYFVHQNNVTLGDCWQLQVARAAIPAIITVATPKVTPVTQRLVTYQAEVLGDLDERIGSALVTFSIQRGSTVSEILATTPALGETVTVANVPIDRNIEFDAGFAVFKDAVEMTEGAGAGEYTVDEALGEITFGAAEPVAGPVYTARYAHPATPASPAHGTVVDANVFTSILGIAQTRVSFPVDVEGHIDIVSATTPT